MVNLEVIQGLEKARSMILNPANWKNSAPTFEERHYNNIHCTLTAIYDAESVPKRNYNTMNSFIRIAMKEIDPTPNDGKSIIAIDSWNDTHTHEEVIAAFNLAIGLAKKEYEKNVKEEIL
jgi:hypothetical protein